MEKRAELMFESRNWFFRNKNENFKREKPLWGTWVAQLVKWNFSSGHDLTACEFKPCVGLCVDRSELGACFGFCVSLSLCPSPLALCLPTRALSPSVSKINKH